MEIHFSKMHATGNDFMVIDATTLPVTLNASQIKQLSHRKTGVGFDQLLLIKKSNQSDIDFFYQIYNADGSEVGQCGNGARAIAYFINKKQLCTKKNFLVKTNKTKMQLYLNDDLSVTVDMGIPDFTPQNIPIESGHLQKEYSISFEGVEYFFHAISMGNPHAVIFVKEHNDDIVNNAGAFLSTHPFFPEKANINFAKIINHSHIALRVYERGSGETLSCGSGACASAACGITFASLKEHVRVDLPGGSLSVHWPGKNQSIWLTGSANFVYDGVLTL